MPHITEFMLQIYNLNEVNKILEATKMLL